VIYLDYNATTPLDSLVFEAMAPYMTERWGNPSSDFETFHRLRISLCISDHFFQCKKNPLRVLLKKCHKNTTLFPVLPISLGI
jgi:hypothetical protein